MFEFFFGMLIGCYFGIFLGRKLMENNLREIIREDKDKEGDI